MDIFHGKKYFDSRKPEWSNRNNRYDILLDLAMVIRNCSLPIVAGFYVKEKFGAGDMPYEVDEGGKAIMIHGAAALDCLMWTERWLANFAPTEKAIIIHEDGPQAKRLIKAMFPTFLSGEELMREGLPEKEMRDFNLPFKNIIDTIHFVAKPDARALQLADLCAFCLSRGLRRLPFIQSITHIFWEHIAWIGQYNKVHQK